MIQLNLPPYAIKLAGNKEKPTIFDILRRKYVALTPEEWVRQHFVHFLVEHKGYPATLLANEVKLQVGDKQLRADTVLYDNGVQGTKHRHQTTSFQSDYCLQHVAACRLSGGFQRDGTFLLPHGLRTQHLHFLRRYTHLRER